MINSNRSEISRQMHDERLKHVQTLFQRHYSRNKHNQVMQFSRTGFYHVRSLSQLSSKIKALEKLLKKIYGCRNENYGALEKHNLA